MQFRFSIKSSTHYLGFLRQMMAVIDKIEPAFKHDVVASCSLALVEAVNNAIFHAHNKDSGRWIDIVMKCGSSVIEIEVSDMGPGFEMPEFTIPPLDHTHGRGLFIIKSVMHEVEYVRGKKNVLKMRYYLSPLP